MVRKKHLREKVVAQQAQILNEYQSQRAHVGYCYFMDCSWVDPWRAKHFLEIFFLSNAAMWKQWKVDEKQLCPKKIG